MGARAWRLGQLAFHVGYSCSIDVTAARLRRRHDAGAVLARFMCSGSKSHHFGQRCQCYCTTVRTRLSGSCSPHSSRRLCQWHGACAHSQHPVVTQPPPPGAAYNPDTASRLRLRSRAPQPQHPFPHSGNHAPQQHARRPRTQQHSCAHHPSPPPSFAVWEPERKVLFQEGKLAAGKQVWRLGPVCLPRRVNARGRPQRWPGRRRRRQPRILVRVDIVAKVANALPKVVRLGQRRRWRLVNGHDTGGGAHVLREARGHPLVGGRPGKAEAARGGARAARRAVRTPCRSAMAARGGRRVRGVEKLSEKGREGVAAGGSSPRGDDERRR
ncbi:hypothetical protein BU14_0573s0007 [Porphyra umbilicalis]|uniref:Uncharacterized protein n=1 Tax=Porphyra umbilicalis TaxID=2786 RepID=A0A1X6NRL3_PORUM|nr:hypothetical protein BU14_0573s0007 [Porphyra umbilicalis]|eukprot:OSX71251.1 hypothetical protein BU14_0573s0007 [Porphyra umbilicalis]